MWITDVLVGPFVPFPKTAASVRARLFLTEIEHTGIESLEALNDRFEAWAEQINARPPESRRVRWLGLDVVPTRSGVLTYAKRMATLS